MERRTPAWVARRSAATGRTRCSASNDFCSGVAVGLIEPYNKPWLFLQALDIVRRVIRPVQEGGKIAYADGVDPREICNLRYPGVAP